MKTTVLGVILIIIAASALVAQPLPLLASNSHYAVKSPKLSEDPFFNGSVPSIGYHHKSEAELAALTPAQKVDEYADEEAHHRYIFGDRYSLVILRFLFKDGDMGVSRITEIIHEYDPTSLKGKIGKKGERFDAMVMLLMQIDFRAVRLRGSAEGLKAITALERVIDRMHQAHFDKPKDYGNFSKNGRPEEAESTQKYLKGVNMTDQSISDTLRLKYQIKIS